MGAFEGCFEGLAVSPTFVGNAVGAWVGSCVGLVGMDVGDRVGEPVAYTNSTPALALHTVLMLTPSTVVFPLAIEARASNTLAVVVAFVVSKTKAALDSLTGAEPLLLPPHCPSVVCKIR